MFEERHPVGGATSMSQPRPVKFRTSVGNFTSITRTTDAHEQTLKATLIENAAVLATFSAEGKGKTDRHDGRDH